MTFLKQELRLCLFIDVENYGRRPEPEQVRVQAWLRDILDNAARIAGLTARKITHQEQGDGSLLVINVGDRLAGTVHSLIVGLYDSVNWVNEPLRDCYKLRVRVALAFGLVTRAENGFVGRPVVTAARLANSGAVREMLKDNAESAIAIALPAALYDDILAQSPMPLPPGRFGTFPVEEKELFEPAWIGVLMPPATGTPNLRSGGFR